MKILDEETKVIYRNGFLVKQITAEIDHSTDVDFRRPEIQTLKALYKNKKIIGIITEISKRDLIYPILFKINLIDNKYNFAVFNSLNGSFLYKGNDKIKFNDVGFETEQEVILKTYYDNSGNATNKKITSMNKNLKTVQSSLDEFDNDLN